MKNFYRWMIFLDLDGEDQKFDTTVIKAVGAFRKERSVYETGLMNWERDLIISSST